MDSRKIGLLFLIGLLSLIVASGAVADRKWVLTMTTENSDGSYQMTLGVMPGATDTYEAVVLGDAADQIAAPGLPPGRTTRIDSSGVSGVPGDQNLVEDIRSDKSTVSWETLGLVVQDSLKPATLSWDLSQVPTVPARTVTLTATGTFFDDSFQPILTDPVDMQAVSEVGPIAVAAGTLAVTIESPAPPTIFSGEVVLADSAPTTWSYTLLQDFNTVTQWSYTGANITAARAPDGWNVTTQTDTQVVFEGSHIEGALEGFEIDGDVAGVGEWQSGLGSGTIDGPLSITLSGFTASTDGLNVIISWTTESEYENMGFYIYRSETPTGPFTKLNGEIIAGAGTTSAKHTYGFTDEDVELGKTYYYYLENIDFRAHKDISKILRVDMLESKPMTLKTQLLPNYPNPFNPETWIPYELAQDSKVTIEIYSITGELVRTLRLGSKAAGLYTSKSQAAYWDGISDTGEKLSSGIYFYIMKTGDVTATRRMVLVK
jgi:hypothetical protein